MTVHKTNVGHHEKISDKSPEIDKDLLFITIDTNKKYIYIHLLLNSGECGDFKYGDNFILLLTYPRFSHGHPQILSILLILSISK
jgi:hypothetical protein